MIASHSDEAEPMRRARERAMTEAFVWLADTLVDNYDVIELLNRLAADCVRLLAIDAAGLLLSDQRGHLRVVSSSTERARLLELFQLQSDEGPCLECYRTGRVVIVADLADTGPRWPKFAPHALQEGFRSVHALPLRLRSETIGTLNLFHTQPGSLPGDDLRLGQALADVATISILQERAVRRSEVLTEQLQVALNSRVIIEQAKGVIAAYNDISMDAAFDLLRHYARNHNQRLTDIARAVADGNKIDELFESTVER